MTNTYEYTSCLAPYIKTLIALKKSAGYVYDTESYHLRHFDLLCVKQDIHEPIITKELMTLWGTLRESEGKSYLTRRISAVRQLCLYMNSIGITAYIPTHFNHQSNFVAYVMNDKEIITFFDELDKYKPKISAKVFNRLAVEYKIIFRIIYCCGLRISEARKLTVADVNLNKGMLILRQSKGNKDRQIYMADDLALLCKEYIKVLKNDFHIESEWFFPGTNPANIIALATLDQRFNIIWYKVTNSMIYLTKPTVHSLRHSYVVKRMNLWIENGENLNAMMPYLSKYLGHKSVNDTFYYYHLIESAFKLIREKDALSLKIIPEVDAHE